ncbi:MAG: hypothetical protein M3169_12240 [Candidatus Eremiobacteraeota bacterium]|nr:hypothetical protein [Candidatus Eremiobacteraeota bacterium]
MGGFGDLFGALGELFGGVTGAVGEGAVEAVAGGVIEGVRGGEDAPDVDATYERYLAGAPRALNVNDL